MITSAQSYLAVHGTDSLSLFFSTQVMSGGRWPADSCQWLADVQTPHLIHWRLLVNNIPAKKSGLGRGGGGGGTLYELRALLLLLYPMSAFHVTGKEEGGGDGELTVM